MKRVIIESPYTADTEWKIADNIRYAQKCVADSIRRGEAPIASHLLYTQPGILNDSIPCERVMGISAGLAWTKKADLVAVYTDLGISSGMLLGINEANRFGIPVEYREIGKMSDENKLTLHPTKSHPVLDQLLEESVEAYKKMSPEEKARAHKAQAISWVYGNLTLDGCNITREQVEKHFDELYGKP